MFVRIYTRMYTCEVEKERERDTHTERRREGESERHAELNGFELAHKFAYTSSIRRRMVGGVRNVGGAEIGEGGSE